jgi:oxygen-dependent protoporphyrinogen oxidase
MPLRVVVVGGGITGLAAAHALTHAERPVDVTLLERDTRLGGRVFTERRDGFILDAGADSWLASKPAATKLAKAVGLESDLIGTVEQNRRVYVLWQGKLYPLPEGVVLGVPTEVLPMIRTGLFTWRAKVRMGLEPLVPRRVFEGDDDETIADFISRRLGQEATERLASPLLGGIYAGDARELSVRATLPQFVQAEQEHGSLVRAMRAQRRAASHGRSASSAFLSLRSGMGSLVDAVASSLPPGVVEKGAAVKCIRPLEGDARGRWAVERETGSTVFADDVVLAVPAFAAARFLSEVDAGLAAQLDAIPFASTAAVALAFRKEDIGRPLDATGYICARARSGSNGNEAVVPPALAATWISSKWEGRAPADRVLLRVFLGGAGREGVLDQDDDALVRIAREELSSRVGARGEPLLSRVYRFSRGSPQPVLGHLARVRLIRERAAQWAGLHLGGAGYESVGVPACVEQGQRMAASILARV